MTEYGVSIDKKTSKKKETCSEILNGDPKI
jgi:hypothetical protein